LSEIIVVSYGKDIVKSAYDSLAASDIGSYLRIGSNVSIKPNLVVPCPAWDGATTHPEVVEGLILFLKDFGIDRIRIIEGSWVGDSTKEAFRNCGYEALSKRYGIPLIDLKSDKCTVLKHGGFKVEVCNEALGTDFLINVPVLKAHCQTRFTCCMKNLKGCIPDSEKRRFHSLGLHKPIAVLNALIKTGYCVVDGICGDLSFEEGGNPVVADRIIVGHNPLLVDSFCAELIGYKPDEIEHLLYGREIGIGEYFSSGTDAKDPSLLVELNPQSKPLHDAKGEHKTDRSEGSVGSFIYKKLIEEDAACSACYSSLIYALHRNGGRVRSNNKIHIGQGFKGISGEGIGIGNCTKGFAQCVAGCPPKATDIIESLR